MCSRAAWKVFQGNNFLLENVDSTVLKSPLGTCQACHNCGWRWGRLVSLQRGRVALPDLSPASWVDDRLKKNLSFCDVPKWSFSSVFCKLSQIFDFSYMIMGELFALRLWTKQQFCFLASLRNAVQLPTCAPSDKIHCWNAAQAALVPLSSAKAQNMQCPSLSKLSRYW